MSKPRKMMDRAALADVEVERRITGDSADIRRNLARIASREEVRVREFADECRRFDVPHKAVLLERSATLLSAVQQALDRLIENDDREGNTPLVQDAQTILSEALASLPQE